MTSGKKAVVVVVGAAVLLVGLVLVATLLGAFLPREHSLSRSVRISQPPEAVWQVITDYARQPAWRPELKSVEQQPDRNDRETWKLTDQYGVTGYMEVVEAVPPRRLVQAFTDTQGNPMGPSAWEYKLAPSDGGTRVTLTQHGNYPNPFLRFVTRFLIGYGKFADDYLRALARKFGDPPTIYVEDADAVYQRALRARGTSVFEPRDEPYGDRVGGVMDPLGHTWFMATHLRDVSL